MNGIHNALSVTIVADAAEAIQRGYDWTTKPEVKPIRVKKVIVVEQGTVSGKATVDFLLEDEIGQQFVFLVTGDLLKSIPC